MKCPDCGISGDHSPTCSWWNNRIAVPAPSGKLPWPDPTPAMLNDPTFNAIWDCIKSWDINVPDAYTGYCGATGNHARAIYDALKGSPSR